MMKEFLVFSILLFPFAASADFTRDLYFGLANDSDVIELQEFLRREGYFTYPESTGNYFSVTLDAVQKFQQANGLDPIGGYFGPQSRAKANEILSSRPTTPVSQTSVSSSFGRDLYFGLRSDPDVVRLQEFLRGRGFFTYPENTGNFFTVTLQAVQGFQRAQNISPSSGYFGPITRGVVNQIVSSGGSVPMALDAPSSAKEKIVINSVSGFSERPENESMTIYNQSDANVNITGFVIESEKARFTIPLGHLLPGFSARAQDQVVLKPRERAVISAGKQARLMDFRENLCTGYFTEFSDFTPSLSHRCPRVDTRTLTHLSDQCLLVIDRTSTCRQADFSKIFESNCSEYVNKHLNYAGCVEDYKNRIDFYSDQWLIWMQRNEEFFRNVHDKIILRDQSGRIVDEYVY